MTFSLLVIRNILSGHGTKLLEYILYRVMLVDMDATIAKYETCISIRYHMNVV